MIYLEDEGIVVRDIVQDDAVSLFVWWVDKEINKYDPRPIPENSCELLQECKEFCKRFDTEIINTDDFINKYKYFMICNTNDQAIGFVNIFNIDIEKKQCEMGVVIGNKEYWRKGIANKAVKAASDYIFNNTKITRIYIEAGEANIPALRLFEKLAFTKCGEIIDEGFKFIVMELKKSNAI
jgi:RimJ/RimL family protein N-acetyltransferase